MFVNLFLILIFLQKVCSFSYFFISLVYHLNLCDIDMSFNYSMHDIHGCMTLVWSMSCGLHTVDNATFWTFMLCFTSEFRLDSVVVAFGDKIICYIFERSILRKFQGKLILGSPVSVRAEEFTLQKRSQCSG